VFSRTLYCAISEVQQLSTSRTATVRGHARLLASGSCTLWQATDDQEGHPPAVPRTDRGRLRGRTVANCHRSRPSVRPDSACGMPHPDHAIVPQAYKHPDSCLLVKVRPARGRCSSRNLELVGKSLRPITAGQGYEVTIEPQRVRDKRRDRRTVFVVPHVAGTMLEVGASDHRPEDQ